MTRSRQTADWGSRAGLAKVIPSSVAVGSGTGSASSLGTVTFSGASSVSLNGIFTSTYDNYRIVLKATDTGTNSVSFRVRASGTDLSTTTYGRSQYGFTFAGAIDSDSQASSTSITIARANGSIFAADATVFSPFLSENTRLVSQFVDSTRGDSAWGYVNNSTSYDGFTITGTSMTGTVSVYGYTI